MRPGRCLEYNLNDDTSLLTRDERFKDFMDTPYAVVPTTTNERFKLLIFDECHHFPANTYSRLAFLDADYRLGLSGSPYREDGRSELIYVLSGNPYGSDWDKLFEEGWVKRPEIILHVSSAKITLLQSLLQSLKGNTVVFSATASSIFSLIDLNMTIVRPLWL